MLATLLILRLIATAIEDSAPDDPRAAYDAQRVGVGRDADAQVRLALWCERNGLDAERLQHLGLALLADPGHALARSLMGQVRQDGEWVRAEDAAATEAERAEALAEYNRRREAVERNADAHWRLALWCEENGLKPEAEAHFTTVTRLDPNNAAAWRKLGCKPYRGRWLNAEQIAALEADRKAQEKADRHWTSRLKRVAEDAENPRRAAALEQATADITDPRAVPTIWRLLATRGPGGQRAAVRALGQIQSPVASQALAILAVQADDPETRRAAGETLRQRDPREFLHLLILAVRKPLEYEVRQNPRTHSVELYVEGVEYDVHRRYEFPVMPESARELFDPNFFPFAPGVEGARFQLAFQGLINRSLGTTVAPDPLLNDALRQAAADPGNAVGLLQGAARNAPAQRPALGSPLDAAARADAQARFNAERELQRREAIAAENVQRFQQAVAETAARVQADVAEIERTNAAYRAQNDRVLPTLQALTGQDHGADPRAWAGWWTDQQGYTYTPPERPVYRDVIPATQPSFQRIAGGCSCFAAGTLVHTRDGLRPIEAIRLGDQVLAINPHTGALRFEPVVAVWHNQPDQTYRVKLGDETIEATGIHRFWVAGRGWVLARDLKPGDPVRTRSGITRVASVEPSSVQPVFNLEVARANSFLVGKSGALVHDYSIAETIDRPFDTVD
jgi:hypothetical protein